MEALLKPVVAPLTGDGISNNVVRITCYLLLINLLACSLRKPDGGILHIPCNKIDAFGCLPYDLPILVSGGVNNRITIKIVLIGVF